MRVRARARVRVRAIVRGGVSEPSFWKRPARPCIRSLVRVWVGVRGRGRGRGRGRVRVRVRVRVRARVRVRPCIRSLNLSSSVATSFWCFLASLLAW